MTMANVGQALITQDYSSEGFALRLADAKRKAVQLKDIVEQAQLFAIISGRKHLYVEAWATIAEGYGYVALIEWVRPLPDGGYEARAVVKDAFGEIRSAAEAQCGSEGDGDWINRSHFVQESMAQTRAVSKALRLRLSWVVVLAGYEATPAEEMDGAHSLPKVQTPTCPEHGDPLVKTKYGWTHKMPNGRFCNAYRDEQKRESSERPAQAELEAEPGKVPEPSITDLRKILWGEDTEAFKRWASPKGYLGPTGTGVPPEKVEEVKAALTKMIYESTKEERDSYLK